MRAKRQGDGQPRCLGRRPSHWIRQCVYTVSVDERRLGRFLSIAKGTRWQARGEEAHTQRQPVSNETRVPEEGRRQSSKVVGIKTEHDQIKPREESTEIVRGLKSWRSGCGLKALAAILSGQLANSLMGERCPVQACIILNELLNPRLVFVIREAIPRVQFILNHQAGAKAPSWLTATPEILKNASDVQLSEVEFLHSGCQMKQKL